ncbi:hypothetical protein LIER_04491 [Lithospermum erythrorhizon]|uniref:Uncharacterized protein n=1 Tax=Lithospermum erythrorhizon TaxID=34254 RepID=A0AAV3NX60_LITER
MVETPHNPFLSSFPPNLFLKNLSPLPLSSGEYKTFLGNTFLHYLLIISFSPPFIMSDTSNSCPEGQGYNNDVGSYSSPQVSSSLAALAESDSSALLHATPLASRAPSSSRRPPQAKAVKADIN